MKNVLGPLPPQTERGKNSQIFNEKYVACFIANFSNNFEIFLAFKLRVHCECLTQWEHGKGGGEKWKISGEKGVLGVETLTIMQ